MDPERFRNSTIGRLIRVGKGKAGILQLAGDVSYGKTYLATEIMDIIRDKDQAA